MDHKTHIINAAGKVLGRLASEVAVLLRGKDKPDFAPNKDMDNIVIVRNVEKLKIAEKKMSQKKYYHHSGYMGGLKSVSLNDLFKRDPEKVFKKAVFGMLPKNKLRAKMIKRLKYEKGTN